MGEVKLAPHSKESEMMVLGCMLTSTNALSIAADGLNDTDFYFTENQIIFQVLKGDYVNDRPADVHLVCEELRRQERLKNVGGVGYVTTLAQYAGTSAHIEEYVKELKEIAYNRKASKLGEEMALAFLKRPNNPKEIAEKFHQKLRDLSKGHSPDDMISIGEILSGSRSSTDPSPLIDRLQARQEFSKANGGKPFMTGLPTGFIDLDKKVTVLKDTNLVVLAARPAMGKTALGLNIASNVCLEQGFSVAFISLEMGRDQLVERLLSAKTGIAGEKIERGTFDDSEFRKIEEELHALDKANFFIYDQNCSTITQVVSKARKLKEEKDIRLLVIDYIQLMGNGGDSENRQNEVAEISRSLKALARELKIPILCIAQLSRKVEERSDKRPLLSDLRDSGQIEQDADVVIFILRREYYDPSDKPGQAEIIVAKNRHGSTPNIGLNFQNETGKFSNLESLRSPEKYSINF